MKLKSFGCSFIYGSDLSDHIFSTQPSEMVWPAILAGKYGFDYECWARPGQGNFKILCDIISQASLDDPALFVINWTWVDRFDYVDANEKWQTIRPGDDSESARQYFRLFNSQIKDMMTSIYAVYTAIDFLKQRNLSFVMSYMDYSMLDVLNPDWHDPRYISIMQHKIRDHLIDFDGKNFLDWSRDQNFEISERWHPLEQAHSRAAEHMQPIIDAILHKV